MMAWPRNLNHHWHVDAQSEWRTLKTTSQSDKAAIKIALKAGHLIPGAQLTFIPPLGGYRAEYSSDGQSWSEAAPASDLLMFPASISLPLPINPDGSPGFLRVRSLRDRAELPPYVLFQSYQPQFLAAPTEPGHSYSLQSSKDLSEWSSDTPVTGDGSVLTWPLPTWEDHNFFRISRN
jgi:hypothetical protein